MLELFLFAGLPYLSLFLLIFGSIYRYRSNRFSYSALSSQFLEDCRLRWGSLPWHAGILVILAGHLIPFFFPRLWARATVSLPFLLAVETVGMAAALLSLVGLVILLYRRMSSSKLQPVTSVMDLAVLCLLLIQIALGLGIALFHRWGAAWSAGTTTPYLWSLLQFQPDVGLVTDLPLLVKFHLVGAWILFLLVPFSRLIHIFSLPFSYLVRPFQKVVWVGPRRPREETASLSRTTRPVSSETGSIQQET